jgi:hypothetical protein
MLLAGWISAFVLATYPLRAFLVHRLFFPALVANDALIMVVAPAESALVRRCFRHFRSPTGHNSNRPRGALFRDNCVARCSYFPHPTAGPGRRSGWIRD